jgi:hypothetical protein
MLDNSDGEMRPVVYKSRNVILRHLRQLFLEDALQAREDDQTLPVPIVVHNAELNFPSAFLEDSSLILAMLAPTGRKCDEQERYLILSRGRA